MLSMEWRISSSSGGVGMLMARPVARERAPGQDRSRPGGRRSAVLAPVQISGVLGGLVTARRRFARWPPGPEQQWDRRGALQDHPGGFLNTEGVRPQMADGLQQHHID